MSDEHQLHLGPAWANHGLFSRNFLETHIAEQAYWDCDDRAAGVLAEVSRLYRQDYAPSRQEKNEEDTRNAWIDPVLKALGWDYHRERHIRRGRPDYILFLSQGDKRAAVSAATYAGYFSRAAGILEAKYWDRPLNNLVPQDDFDPSDATGQLLGYLTLLDVNSDSKCQWAILSNGRMWRLFYNRAKGKATTYYEVDLLELMNRGDAQQFKYFLCFFEPEAFARDPQTGLTRLDSIVTESQRYAERVSQSLKEAIFDSRNGVFIELGRGFVEHLRFQDPQHDFSDEELDEIHHGTLLLLYRLLFLLYAESRDLLPVRDEHGYGHQSLWRQSRRCAEIVDGRYTPPTRSTDLWSDLLTLFEVIRHGDPKLDVPVYNGGLFEPTHADASRDFFRVSAITDTFLAAGLDRLTRTEDESGNRAWIDYSSLAVQQLGSIYEGLLEFKLRFAPERLVAVAERGSEVWKGVRGLSDEQRRLAQEGRLQSVEAGQLYLTNEKSERKATGSYYTPDYIVKYIVHHAVGPILEGRKSKASELLRELAEKQKAHARLSAPGSIRQSSADMQRLSDQIFDTLFDIRVLDPAMGSGHFLVETVDFLADGIIEFLSSGDLVATRRVAPTQENPVLRRIEHQRRVILDGLEKQGIELTPQKRAVVEAKLSDNNLIRRMVLKRCIYGVDINPLAVELAKVSLWLHCFTLGAPLSFLDHHLRCGNSLLGVTVDEVRSELKKELHGLQLSALLAATEWMRKVGELTDSTFAEVKQSAEVYGKASNALAPFKAMLDMWAAHIFRISGARDLLQSGVTHLQLASGPSGSSSGMAKRDVETLTTVRELVCKMRFFHWELEFPEVWYYAGTRRDNPGFQAVIGNPPYGSSRRIAEARKPRFLFGITLPPDWYASFIDTALALAKKDGELGMIVPQSWETGPQYAEFRALLSKAVWINEVINLPFDVFPDAYVDTCLTFATKAPPRGRPCKWKEIQKGGMFADLDGTPSEDWDVAGSGRPGLGTLGDLGRWVGERGWTTVAEVFQTARGVRLRPSELSRFSSSAIPLWVGKAMRYAESSPRTTLVEPSQFVEGPPDPVWYKGPRLWLRRIVGRDNRLLAVKITRPWVVKKDFYILRPIKRGTNLLPYLGILNSRFFSYLAFQGEVAARKDDFRQTSLDWLRKLPIPVAWKGFRPTKQQARFLRSRRIELVTWLRRAAHLDMQTSQVEIKAWIALHKPEFMRSFAQSSQGFFHILGLVAGHTMRLATANLRQIARGRIAESPTTAALGLLVDEIVWALYGLTDAEMDRVREIIG